jgi:hypothetical protein
MAEQESSSRCCSTQGLALLPHLLHEALVGGRPAGWGRKLVAQRQQPQLQRRAGQDTAPSVTAFTIYRLEHACLQCRHASAEAAAVDCPVICQHPSCILTTAPHHAKPSTHTHTQRRSTCETPLPMTWDTLRLTLASRSHRTKPNHILNTCGSACATPHPMCQAGALTSASRLCTLMHPTQPHIVQATNEL